MSNQTTDVPINSTSNNDWRNILVFSVLVAILGNLLIFYLFFSARLLGLALSSIVNTFILKNSGEISVKSFQISLLTGRICICGVSYGSSCLALRFVDADISINWWGSWTDEIPWIFLTVAGLEYTIINHASQYDRLAALLSSRQPHSKPPDQQVNIAPAADELDDAGLPILFWLSKIIKLKIESGCLRIGNNSLPTVLFISFSGAEGTLSYVPGREPEPHEPSNKTTATELEYHRTVLELVLQEASIDIKENRGFIPNAVDDDEPEPEHPVPASYGFHGLINVFKDMSFPSRADNSVIRTVEDEDVPPEDRPSEGLPGSGQFNRKQSRKRSSPGRRPAATTARERGEHVLISSLVHLRYYDEVVRQRAHQVADLPERGVFLHVLHGGLVYGPWENRQRALIQRHFLPPDFERRSPYRPSAADGGPQARAGFRFGVDFRGSVMLRIPYAESGPGRRADHVSAYERTANAAGWLSLTAGIDQVAMGSIAKESASAATGIGRVVGGQQASANASVARDKAAGEATAKLGASRARQKSQQMQSSYTAEESRFPAY